MPGLQLEWDSRGLDQWRGRKIDAALLRVVSKAGGDALRSMRAQSNRSVRQRKRFKVKRVKDGLPVFFPRSKKELGSLVWRMDPSMARVPLAELPHRQTRKGVTVAVNNGPRKLIKSAFVATLGSGHVGIFTRRGKGRLPIDEAFTTRISDVFNDEGMIEGVFKRTQSVFAASFERLMTLELAKLK